MSLHLLFPTPVLVLDSYDQFDADNQELIAQSYAEEKGSYGDFNTSKDTYILDHHAPALRAWIQQQINEYATNTLASTQPLKITQSWCLKHENQPQKVFKHLHPNSIISGAYYVHAPEGTSNIKFHKETTSSAPVVKWETNEDLIAAQPWAWEWYEVPVQTGRLVLFPSNVHHSVEGTNVNENMRCVLSFNTWFDGPIGSELRLFRLGALQ